MNEWPRTGTWNQLGHQLDAVRQLATLNQAATSNADKRSLPARLWSRVRYLAALTFTARQKQFNLEVVAALDSLRLLVAELHDELADLRSDLEPPHVRLGTLDDAIWTDVNRRNEYSLPDRFDPTDVILDIGMHIGSFSFACLRRGAKAVIGFEPHPENAALAALNLKRFGERGEVRQVAVWRSDVPDGTLRLHTSYDATNTGGGVAGDVAGMEIAAVGFDSVIESALTRFQVPRLRLVKIDCEGSEYPILMTSRCLDRVAAICGEYHESPGPIPDTIRVPGVEVFDRNTLKRFLESQGYRVELRQHTPNPHIGLFFANRAAS